MSNVAESYAEGMPVPAPNGRASTSAGGQPPRTPPTVDHFDEAVVDDALANMKGVHGPGNVVAVLTIRGWAIFRAPTASEAMRYKSLLSDEKTQSLAAGIISRVLVVWPARETFGEWLDERPLIADEVRGPWLELAGLTGKAATKK